MLDTTLSKTARAAELMAAAVLINVMIKDLEADDLITIDEESRRFEILATIVSSTFTPAEA